MPSGYNGKILHVDLTTGDIRVEEPPEAFYRKYLGGSALNLHYLIEMVPAGIDPLAPENVLALSVSVVTGTPISGQSRVTASAKSPLTGAVGDSQSGGFWPAELKFAGFDAVIIRGRAASPVYLWVHDGQAEIRDAGSIWGRITGEAEQAIKAELNDPEVKILQIGPAGEKMVRFASLISMCNRANGRTGMGAVMGSKNLKAVAVRGSRKPSLADREQFEQLSRQGVKAFPESMLAGLGKYGTAGAVSFQQSSGGLPSFNFGSGVFEGWEKIDGVTLYDNFLKGAAQGKQNSQGRDTCYGCVVRCKRVVEHREGPLTLDPIYGGPEYETLAAMGSYCGVDDLAAVCAANQICNQYGLDTISCGATIAWAMEAFKAGELTDAHTGGMALDFGDAKAMLALTQMIARRQGLGDVLAEGSVRAARRLGVGADYLAAGKGLELPAHMPQLKRALGLIYAVNPFGADHVSSGHDPDYEDGFRFFRERLGSLGLSSPQEPLSLGAEKVRYVRITQYLASAADSLNLCQFVFGPTWQLYGPEDLVRLVRSVTGWPVTVEELLAAGERRVNLMRAFNAREGLDKAQDRLSDKFFDKALRGGPTDGFRLDRAAMDAARDEYYRQSGWDAGTGLPTRATLERLDLAGVADMLQL